MAVAPIGITPPVVAIRGLRIEIATCGAAIVDGIDLAVASGEILGLVGESGSGKTTLANAVLGYARHGTRIAAGEVLVAGQDILAASEDARRALRGSVVAHVPQDPAMALNPLGRIGALIGEVLAVHRPTLSAQDRDQAVRAVLGEVGLPQTGEFLRRYPHQLSGGQQQRVLLALAFVLDPRIIVLDEPTTALDVSTQAQVLRLIRTLCRERGIAAIYVSHDLAIVRDLVDRTAVLYAGRIIELARAASLFEQPAHPYTRGLLAAVPELDARNRLRSIPGHTQPPGQRPAGCAFAPRCERAEDHCRAEAPIPSDAGNGHLVACHHPFIDQPLLREALPPATAAVRSDALLSGSGIEAAYGGHQVLFDVSFALQRGLCTALVGQSGSGKSTLARALGGLGTGVTGRLEFAGQALAPGAAPRARDLRRRIQYIFQNPYRALNPRQSVGRNLTQVVRHFFPVDATEAEARAAAALNRVALPTGVLDRRPGQLSGGERQRVAIARALLCEPELLICDEITSALDVSVQAAVLELLESLKADGLTLLFVTHDLAVVRAIADQVLVLNGGRIVEQGAVDDVLDRPADPYTRGLLAHSTGAALSAA